MPKRAREAGSGTATIWALPLKAAPAPVKVALMTTVSEKRELFRGGLESRAPEALVGPLL